MKIIRIALLFFNTTEGCFDLRQSGYADLGGFRVRYVEHAGSGQSDKYWTGYYCPSSALVGSYAPIFVARYLESQRPVNACGLLSL